MRLELRVLVQEVVDVPCLVADDQVVLAALDRVVEDHEVRDEDLVHAADRLEGVEVVLGRLGRDVRRFRGELGAQRVDPLAAGLEHRRDRRLGQPVDLEVGSEDAELVGDGDVALGMTEADRRRDVEGSTLAGEGRVQVRGVAAGRRSCGAASVAGAVLTVMPRSSRWIGRSRGSAGWRAPGGGPGSCGRRPRRRRGARRSARTAGATARCGWQVSSVPWTISIGQVTARQVASTASRSPGRSASMSASIASTDPSSAHSTASSICFVECGSEVISSKKKRTNPGSRAASSGGSASPSLRRSAARRRTSMATFHGCGGGEQRDAGREGDDPLDPLGPRRRELDRPPDAVAAQPDQDRGRRCRWRPSPPRGRRATSGSR